MTKTELYQAILRKLGVLGAGETPQSVDTDLCAEAYEAVCSELGISSGYIEDGTGSFLAIMCASDLSDDFQVEEQRVQRLYMQRAAAKREVLKLTTPQYDTDTVVKGRYY